MGVTVTRSSILVGLLAGVAASTPAVQDGLEKYRTQMANMSANPAAATANNGVIAQGIAQWKAVQQTSALPFDSYSSFLMAHPGWPAQPAIRRMAEGKAADASTSSAVAYFSRFPPMTATAGIAYANALMAMGNQSAAYEAARSAWRKGALTPADEAAALSRFGSAFTPEVHDTRMDALLWQNQTTAAQRQLAYVSPGRRALFAARLAFRMNSPDAAQLGEIAMTQGMGDAGFIADRATWLRNSGASPSARSWLARTRSLTTRPGNVEKFYEVLLTNARAAAADGQWQSAYDIARQIDDAYPAGTDVSAQGYGERDDYTSLAWLAGQAAMKLGRPADAMTMYDRYGRAALAPTTKAKGFYWAGRAAESAGRQSDAQAYLARAGGYHDNFYGQLSNERLGRPLTAPPAFQPRAVSPAQRSAFYDREVVRAAQMLGTIGDWQTQSAFVRQIANDATTDDDHVLATELSRTLDRPDLGVMVGRSAMQNGFTDYSAAGFPTVAIPASFGDQWTMIHAIARQESQFDRAAVSSAGARGLLQLMPGTAREQAGKLGLGYNPASLTSDTSYNIQLGSSYFQRIFNMYGSYPLAIAAYNAGPGNVNKWLRANGDPRTGGTDMVDWIEAIPFMETKNYVQRVLENAVVYDLINPQRAKSRGPANLSWYLGKNRPG